MSYELHGDTGTRLYRIWKSMKCRCNNKNHPTYKWYGARGITVDISWENSYAEFKKWAMSHGYEEHYELDRIDVNKGYLPGNCRWISHHEQTKNRRDTLYAIINENKLPLRDFCIDNHININTVNNWRYLGILEEKLQNITGVPVTIVGGKKKVITV